MSKENNNNALLPSKEFKALCGYHFINLHINHRCMVGKYFFNLKNKKTMELQSVLTPK